MGTIKEIKDRRESFYHAYKTLLGKDFSEQSIVLLKEALSCLGITLSDLFEETDSSKLRLFLSELIVKRSICKIESFEAYLTVCSILLVYIECLENPNVDFSAGASKIDVPITRNKTADSLTVAYYLSRFNKNALQELGYNKFTSAFENLGQIMHQKPATLKNMRDEYDPYFDNGRKGWYQKALAGSRKEIFDKYADISFGKMSTIVKEIIKAYSIKTEESCEDGHRKIKISSNNMKEINSKRKK